VIEAAGASFVGRRRDASNNGAEHIGIVAVQDSVATDVWLFRDPQRRGDRTKATHDVAHEVRVAIDVRTATPKTRGVGRRPNATKLRVATLETGASESTRRVRVGRAARAAEVVAVWRS
jgi:hypothetical protein